MGILHSDDHTAYPQSSMLWADRGSYHPAAAEVDKSTGEMSVVSDSLITSSVTVDIHEFRAVFIPVAERTNIYRHFLYDNLHFLPMLNTGENRPLTYSLGAVVNDRSQDVEIWNAYLEPLTISAVTVSQVGVTIDMVGNEPIIFAPLQTRTHVIEVDDRGASTINATITMESDHGDWLIYVNGYRTYAMPLWPQAPLVEVLSPKTWIYTSENGKEQRMDMRDIPRRTFSFDTLATGTEWLRMVNLLRSQRGLSVALPLYNEAAFVTTDHYIGDVVLNVDTSNSEYFVDGYAGIYYAPTQIHFAKILSMNASSVTLEQPLWFDAIGGARIFPVVICQYAGGSVQESTLARSGGDGVSHHLIKWKFETVQGDDLRGYVAPVQINGYNVLQYMTEDLGADDHQIDQWEVDFGFGSRISGTNEIASTIRRNYKISLAGFDEVWDFRRFVHTHTNRVPFWFSTGKMDIVNSASIPPATSQLDILDVGGFFAASAYRLAVAIHYPDGSTDYREILTITQISELITRLTIDPTDNAVEYGAVEARISFLLLARIDGDVTLRHSGYKTEVSFRAVEVFQ